ncbi:MAG: metallophosphoesterase [Prevotella sp.]|jgi:predicted phosphodiesterase|nr:metallophosphoesterase [Prevotella sp.]
MKNFKCPLSIISLLFFLAACTNDFDETQVITEKSIYPNFAVISDIHIGRPDSKDKVIKTLNVMSSRNPQLDAIFVVGDLTDTSKDSQYNGLIQIFSTYASNLPVYYMLGNHDQLWTDGNPETLYINKLKQPLHQYIDIKGFPFITISLRGGGYTQEEIDFLSLSLEDASKRYPGLPIFVFAHIGVINTVYGTGQHEGWGSGTLAHVFEKYPQAILFSGHSHFPIGDPRSIHQESFTSVNLGSVTYSEIESGFSEGEHPPGNNEVTEGVIVAVKENLDLEIERWDTYRNEEILPRWVIKAPHNGSAFTYSNRNGGNAPVFKENDIPIINDITPNGCVVLFPQATDDEVVHHYIIEISNNSDQVYRSITIFSQFYLNSLMPTSLKTNIANLESETRYTVQITAVDSYSNKSAKIKSTEFTTGL